MRLTEFDITAGVLQGDTLAPFLFVIVLDYALRKAINGREHDLGFTITPRRSRRDIGVAVTDLDFADDIALLSYDVEQAQSLLGAVEKECERIGLFLNDKKTKVLTCNTTLTKSLTTGNEKALEEVNDYRYLGSWINSTEHDIKVRKALAWRARNSMRKVWKS